MKVLTCSIILILFAASGAFAQSVKFSSAGTSSDFDSLYNNIATRQKGRLNPSLYKDQYKGKADGQLQQYREKYNGSFDEVQKYRSKLTDPKLPSELDNFKKKSNIDETYRKIQEKSRLAKSFAPIVSKGLKLDSNTVFNNKLMKSYMDSLNKTLPAKPTVPFDEVPKDQLVKEVNDQFANAGDSLRDSSRLIGKAQRGKDWVDLNYARITSADKNQLQPLVASMVESSVLKAIDSLRIIDLKAARTKMDEHEKNGREKVAKFREKESFIKKSYLEGILSMGSSLAAGSIQFSPAWAYHVLPSWSVGGGPNFIINRKASNFKLDVGARLLTKYELLHRMLYVQLEDKITPMAMNSEERPFTQHSFLGGGGFVVPFLSPLTLNLAAMYRFYSNKAAMNDGSPWVIRVGISTNSKRK